MKLKKNNISFLSKGKHQCIPTPLRFSLYNGHYVTIALCIYVIGVAWNPRMHYTLCIST
jgi:hypothetical protein